MNIKHVNVQKMSPKVRNKKDLYILVKCILSTLKRRAQFLYHNINFINIIVGPIYGDPIV